MIVAMENGGVATEGLVVTTRPVRFYSLKLKRAVRGRPSTSSARCCRSSSRCRISTIWRASPVRALDHHGGRWRPRHDALGRLQWHHPHPEHRLVADVDIVLAH